MHNGSSTHNIEFTSHKSILSSSLCSFFDYWWAPSQNLWRWDCSEIEFAL